MVQSVDIVLLGLQSPSAPSVPPLALPLGSLDSVVVCEYLHLYWLGAGRTSQGTAIPGSCQQVLLCISNSMGVWCLLMGWIPRWGGVWMVFPSGSVPFFLSLSSLWIGIFLG